MNPLDTQSATLAKNMKSREQQNTEKTRSDRKEEIWEETRQREREGENTT